LIQPRRLCLSDQGFRVCVATVLDRGVILARRRLRDG
jgi:hypothetical protein